MPGQRRSGSPERIEALRKLIDRHNPACELEVDGGINDQTGPLSAQKGANVLVMASALYGDPQGAGVAMKRIRGKLGTA